MILSKQDYKHYLDEDRKALGIKKGGGISLYIRQIVAPHGIWKFEKCLRRLEYYTNVKSPLHNVLKYAEKLRFRKLSLKLGFSIPINVIDPGLSIVHYGTIVISNKAKIGKNCRIHVGVNIGASGGKPEAPQIGDNVYIGPGAILFGNISIANNVTIGANATVNKSCHEECVVLAGTPAKIVKRDYNNWTEVILHHN